MKRYSHPEHGFHVADGLEAEAMLKNGWKECGWEPEKPPEERKTLKLPKKKE